ncbi:twin-arginine translocation pathway signal [Ottowia sp. GY511]|uniref:YSC84-related protein n=1 Tax=Ottowia flava TaxID=2675430 RepID=A0ABW4KWG8_9BURK|nr:YSC84-related protein [Ottowia sp. GY511]TXK24765.1 twin-arginine translocation pathway signal [Ottowia sp. GY511]
MNKSFPSLRTLGLAAALAVGGIAFVGCTTTPAGSEASGPSARNAMDQNVDATLARLYSTVPGSRELVQRAAGTLVFPSVVGGAFVVGAEYGKGALREGGRTSGYYSTTAGSVGLQAGGQSKSVVYVFNTPEALQKFKSSKGWTAGADATVAAGKIGANGSVDTQTYQQAVTSFVLTNVGLEAGAAVGAAKITQISM